MLHKPLKVRELLLHCVKRECTIVYHCVCVSTIIPLSVSADTTIPSTTTTHTITGIDNRVDNGNTYYTVMTTTIDQSTISLCVDQVDDKIFNCKSLTILMIV